MARLAVVPELETELDRLYGLPLDEFTSARNELAGRLKKAGQGDAAEAVHALRKPSVALWAVNQLARRNEEGLKALLDAGRALRRAQEQALRGKSSDALRAATAAERTAVRELTTAAEELLADEGRPATQQTLERIAQTLRAAAVDPEAEPLLSAGRLSEGVEASGFAALAEIAPPAHRSGRKQERRPSAAERRQREQARRGLEARIGRLERAAAQADEEASRAERAAVEARERLEGIRAELEAAHTELDQLERSGD